MKINIGPGGRWIKKGWKTIGNQGVYPSLKYKDKCDYFYDILDMESLPFDDDTIELFYISHVLEHIPDKYIKHLFDEIYRCCEQSGGLRIVVPDVEMAYSKIKNNDLYWFNRIKSKSKPIEKFFDMFCQEKYKGEIINKINKNDIYKNLGEMNMNDFFNHYTKNLTYNYRTQHHLNWFSFVKLRKMLYNSGFNHIYRMSYNTSNFYDVVNQQIDFKNRINWSMFVEAIK